MERYIDQKSSDRDGFYYTNYTQLKFLRVTQCDSAVPVPHVLFPGEGAANLGVQPGFSRPTRPPGPTRPAGSGVRPRPPRYSPWAGRSECRDGRRRSRRSWRRRPGPAPLHFNRQRRRSARPGGAPRASRTQPSPSSEAGLQAGAGGSCAHSRTRLTALTGALGRRVRGCPGDARTPASSPRDPCRPGTTFPTVGGRQRAAPTRAVLGKAEPRGVAPGA